MTNHTARSTAEACFDWRIFVGVAVFVLIPCMFLAPWPSGGMSGAYLWVEVAHLPLSWGWLVLPPFFFRLV